MTLTEAIAALKSDTSPTELDLSNHRIDDVSVKDLATALEDNHVLRSLNLFGNNIGPDGALYLVNGIKDNDTLISLNLGDNKIGPEGAKDLAIILKANRALTTLNLYLNKIGPVGTQYLATTLKDNDTLSILDLGLNGIGPAGAEHLATALKDNDTVIELNLTSNYIGDEGANHFATLLKGNNTLISLNLYHNKIGNAGAKYLANGLKDNNTLTSLYLSRNDFGPAGAQYLASMLKNNYSLTTLDLSCNHIDDSGIKALAIALIDNHTLLSFISLDINGNDSSHEALRTFDGINLIIERNRSTQTLITSTLALIENLNASQPDPFDQPEQSVIHFKNTRDILDALNYPKKAIGYIKIQTGMTLLEAKLAKNQLDYDTAIEKLSTLTSSNPYFKIAQTALIDMAMRLLSCIGDNEERYALIKKTMASVADSNQAKHSILNILKNSEAIAAGEKATPPLYAYHSERSRSIDGTKDQSDDLKPEAKKLSSNQN